MERRSRMLSGWSIVNGKCSGPSTRFLNAVEGQGPQKANIKPPRLRHLPIPILGTGQALLRKEGNFYTIYCLLPTVY